MFIDVITGNVSNDGSVVHNGRMSGPIGGGLAEVRYEPGMLRPFINNQGHRCVTIQTGRTVRNDKGIELPERKTVLVSRLMERGIYSPVFNATTLRKDAWIQLDQAIVRAARERLRAYADLEASNSFGGFDAMAKATLEYEAMNDPGEAMVDMDAIAAGRSDAPLFKLRSLPLPITHSDFWFSARRLAISRNSSTPLDTVMAEAAGRRVAEAIERTVIFGSGANGFGLTYGSVTSGPNAHDSALTSTVYGYTDFPYRNTKTNLATPTGSNPEATVADILSMRNTLYADKMYGPYMIYHSTDWDQYLDNDYARLGGNNASMTLRDRLRKIEGVLDVRRLDFLTSTFTLIMVQMTSQVARAINGMDITTVQWEGRGGMQVNFKVMAIKVPHIQADYSGNCGILHATTA